ncbi:MAG: hypothetical protein HOI15_13015, partial [Opitutales bacterium]|nr:hypothetical protein [Opitutales bacterium]
MISYIVAIQYRYFKYQLLLMTIAVMLQRSPIIRIASLLDRALKTPISRIIQLASATFAASSSINALSGATAFTSNPTSPTTANVGETFNLVFAVTGSPSAVKSWEVLGSVPPGLSIPGLNGSTLNSKVGSLTGTPTTAGTYNLTVQAFGSLNRRGDTDKKRYPISISVSGEIPPPETVFTATPSATTTGTVGTEISQTFSITGLNARSWKISGAIPQGLTITGPNNEPTQGTTLNAVSGQISGIPTNAGAFNFSVQAYDQENLAGITDGKTHSLSMTINEAPPPETVFTASPSNNVIGIVGSQFSQSFSISGLDAASWKILGSIPPGLTATGPSGETLQGSTLNASSGILSGIPSTEGIYNLTVQAYDQSDLAGITDEKSYSLQITINPTAAALPDVVLIPSHTVVDTLARAQFFVKGDNYTSIQWLRNGVEITAAQSDTLIIENAIAEDEGFYQARLTNESGSTLSAQAVLTIDDAATSQLVNVSTRGYVGPGEEALIPGFVFGGTKSKTFLIRAAGPALASLGIDTPLADPVITLYKGQS